MKVSGYPVQFRRSRAPAGSHLATCNRSEVVKKLKTAKIRRHKSLITNGGILCFGAFCQLFHSFSMTADGARAFQSAGSSSRTTGLRIGCRSAFERCCGLESPRSAICARVH